MFRGFVCYILISLLFANQAIAMGCPHEHTGMTPDGHSERPHLHTGVHVHQQFDGRHLHEHCLDHVAQNRGLEHPQPTSEHSHDAASCDEEVPCGHDCDAIYIAAQELHYLPTVQQDLVKVGLDWVAFVVVDWPQPTPSVPPILPVAQKGPFSQERCALYLQILCLRI